MRWLRFRRRDRGAAAYAPRHRAMWAEPAVPPMVRLGFDDGSEIELDDANPAAMALQAVADVLLRKEPA